MFIGRKQDAYTSNPESIHLLNIIKKEKSKSHRNILNIYIHNILTYAEKICIDNWWSYERAPDWYSDRWRDYGKIGKEKMWEKDKLMEMLRERGRYIDG